MNKRNYWLKLKEEFYKQPFIKKLRKIAGGDTYVIIYQEILILSIKTNGYLFFQHIEETLEEELTLILDEELINVKATLSFMQSQNLIEKIENDKYLLPDMLSLIGSESESAERVRAYRERKQIALHCNADVTKCNENVTTDIDIDKDINKYSRINSNIYNNSNNYANTENAREFFEKLKTLKAFKNLQEPNQPLFLNLISEFSENNVITAAKFIDYKISKGKDIKDPLGYLISALKNKTYQDISEIEIQQNQKENVEKEKKKQLQQQQKIDDFLDKQTEEKLKTIDENIKNQKINEIKKTLTCNEQIKDSIAFLTLKAKIRDDLKKQLQVNST
ncbi:MAG: phage replisome organizer N-terminal domain-containing protein [bacterium]